MQPKKEILGPIELIKESFHLFFQGKNLGYLMKATFAIFGIEILPMIATALPIVILIAMSSSGSENGIGYAVLVILAILGGITSVAVGIWGQIAMIFAVQNVIEGKIGPVREVLSKAWSRLIGRLFILSILLGLLIFAGFLLFIIPGIIFMIWFSFAAYVLLFEKRGVMESLSRSKKLVSGRFWTVLGYFLLYYLFNGIVVGALNTFIPLVGSLVTVVFSAFFVFFPLLLYRELVKING